MDQGLLKTRNVFIDKILELEDSSIAILLLIHFSRHQNLFLHNPKDWEDSPTDWLTEDKRIQDEIIGILSFVILYSLTNAHVDNTIHIHLIESIIHLVIFFAFTILGVTIVQFLRAVCRRLI